MAGSDEYRKGLLLLLLLVLALVAAVLARVLATLFFAITVAYVLYPIHRRLVGRRIPPRIASGSLTLGASASVLVVLLPILSVVYRRRDEIMGLLRSLPDVLTVEVGEFSYAVETAVIETAVRDAFTSFAVTVAQSSPTLAMKSVLFATVVYALLLAPNVGRRVLGSVVPVRFHGVIQALHLRIRNTLYAIYGLQTMMGVIAFVLSFALFSLLGYDIAFILAVVSGVLQFLPLIGPMVLIVVVVGYEFALGDPTRGVLIVVFGVVVFAIGLDAVVRPQLARRTARLPASLYLTGFIGGVLSLGPIGFVAGPLVVAILVEVVDLFDVDLSEQIDLGAYDSTD